MLEFSVHHAEVGAYDARRGATRDPHDPRRVRGINAAGKHFLGRALLQSLTFLSFLRYSPLSRHVIIQGVPRGRAEFLELSLIGFNPR